MNRNPSKIRNVLDARNKAEKALPKALFDHAEGGAEDEITKRDNSEAYRAVKLLPRAATFPPNRSLATTVLGHELSMPLIIGPCGGVRLYHRDGDRAIVKAAGKAGTAYCFSTATRTPPEDMAAVASGPLWFQLYFKGAQSNAEALIDRVASAGMSALFVTVDSAGYGNRERMFAHSGYFPMKKNLRHFLHYFPQMVSAPRWTAGFFLDGAPTNFTSFSGRSASKSAAAKDASTPSSADDNARSCPTWADIEWIRRRWTRPLVVKGVLTPEDAVRARELGADGIVVSNHGGRQLDSVPATLRQLEEIKNAVGDSVEVLIDGGIRRGTDVIKALALGADACLIGRPYIYGLSVAGEAGVSRILEIFQSEMIQALGQLGCSNVSQLDQSFVNASGLYARG